MSGGRAARWSRLRDRVMRLRRNLSDLYSSAALNNYALILGALSAILVGRAVLFQTPEDLFGQLAAFGNWDFLATPGAVTLLQGWLSQRLDAVVGVGILAMSFLLRFLNAPGNISVKRSS
jgi:hypothetical protein